MAAGNGGGRREGDPSGRGEEGSGLTAVCQEQTKEKSSETQFPREWGKAGKLDRPGGSPRGSELC